MSRTTRLLELLVRLQGMHRFTVQSLADEFQVSRRTMLRDLQALSELGVPLTSNPGPHGGYQLIRNQQLPPLTLSIDEAIALVASYESLHQYAATPFDLDTSAAIAKLRATLPLETVDQLDKVRARLAMVGAKKSYQAPNLGVLLQAAIDQKHVRIRYDARSGLSTRVIYPYGLFAAGGYWYCGCFDYKRGAHLSLRVDRVLEVIEEVDALGAPEAMTFRQWLDGRESDATDTFTLQATVTEAGIRFGDWTEFLDGLHVWPDGSGRIEMEIRPEDVDYYARVFIRFGEEATVTAPPELIQSIRAQLTSLCRQYGM